MRHFSLRCCAMILLCGSAPSATLFTADFEGGAFPGGFAANRSNPAGSTSWFTGLESIFPAQAGSANSYLAANFLSAAPGGDINTWLISPLITFRNGASIEFYTRGEVNPVAADRLELRFSPTGSFFDADFTALLLSVNPTLSLSGYPDSWTQYTATLNGLIGPTRGRFAFRYFVPDTSLNGNYIGIDTVNVTGEIPEPATIGSAGAALLLLFAARKRRKS